MDYPGVAQGAIYVIIILNDIYAGDRRDRVFTYPTKLQIIKDRVIIKMFYSYFGNFLQLSY